jgi:tetratricopeptide (TPR) repeat protein
MMRKFFGVVILLFFVCLISCASGIKLQFQQPKTRELIEIKRLVIAPCDGADDAVLVCDYLSSRLKLSNYFLLSDRNLFSAALEQNQLNYDNIKQLDSLSRIVRFLNADAIVFSELKSIEILPDEQGVEPVEKSVWTGEYERDENGQILEEISSTGEKTRKKKFKLQTVDQHFRIRNAKLNVDFRLIDLKKKTLIFSKELIENYTSGKIIKEESQPIPSDDEIKRNLVQNIIDRFLSKIEPRKITVKRQIEKGAALIDSGAVHAKAGRWGQAQEIWNKAEKAFPTDSRIYYNLGLASEAKGDFDSAETYYQQAILLNPKKKLYQKAVEKIRKEWQTKQ